MVRKKLEDTQPIKIDSSQELSVKDSVSPHLSDTQSLKVQPKRWKLILSGFAFLIFLTLLGGSI